MAKRTALDEFMGKRQSASYDANKVDPATVAVLNAAEDIGAIRQPDLNLSPGEFQRAYSEALLHAYNTIPGADEIARTQPSLPDEQVQTLEAYGLEKGYLARNPNPPHNCYDALQRVSEPYYAEDLEREANAQFERTRNLAAWSEVVGATFDPGTADVVKTFLNGGPGTLTAKGEALVEAAERVGAALRHHGIKLSPAARVDAVIEKLERKYQGQSM